MGVFDITQSVVNDSAGVIISDTSIDIATVITDIEAKLDAMSVGGLLGLWFQSLFVGLTMKALSICIMLVVYGRMIEIYLVTSIAPIPVATMVNREWGGMGQNYLKSLLALGFQAFLILVCVGMNIPASTTKPTKNIITATPSLKNGAGTGTIVSGKSKRQDCRSRVNRPVSFVRA